MSTLTHSWRRALIASTLSATAASASWAQQQVLDQLALSMDTPFSFEQQCGGDIKGIIAAGWTSNTVCGATKATYSLVPTIGSTGSSTNAMAINVSLNSRGETGPLQFYAKFVTPAKGGNRYDGTVKVKSSVPLELSVGIRQEGDPSFNHDVKSVWLDGQNWQTVKVSALRPAGLADENNLLLVYVAGNQGGAYTLWVDDASVIQTAVSAPAANSPTNLYRTGLVVTKAMFGVHQLGGRYHDPKPYNLGSAVGTERLWDTTIQMSALFPDAASAQSGVGGAWGEFENRIKTAQAKGTDLIMVLGGNLPDWAAADPKGQYKAGGCGDTGGSGPPKDLAVWKLMVDTLVKKADGRIKYWEISNEPYNCVLSYSRVPKLVNQAQRSYGMQYLVTMAQIAYTSVKSSKNASGASHGLQVISPSFNANSLETLDRYLGLMDPTGVGRKFHDIVAVHNYCDEIYGAYNKRTSDSPGDVLSPPETCLSKWAIVQNVRNVLARYGQAALPVWDTESRVGLGPTKLDEAAPFVARHYVMSFITGVDRSYYYTWDQYPMDVAALANGTTDASGNNTFVKNVVGKAYEVVAGWMTGATIKKVTTLDSNSNGQMLVTIRRPGASVDEYLAWIPSGAATNWSIPSGLTKVTNLAGVSTTVSPLSTISLNGSMVLIGN
jgi:hypothetical protein